MEPKEVKVIWIDPSTNGGWCSESDFCNLEDMRMKTKGFLIKEDDKEQTIVVAGTIGEKYKEGDDVMNPLTIPRHAIIEIIEEGSDA